MPGKKFVILGSGDVGMIMARRLTLEGAEVKAVVEILPYVGGLIRNEVQCLYDFNIPLLLEHTVTNIHGLERVEAVTVAKVDTDCQPVPGTERTVECDTLLLSVGLIPENELSTRAGVELDPITGGPIVNDRMETNVPGIFAGGNVVHVHDLVDNVSEEAETAGFHAAQYTNGKIKVGQRKINLITGTNIKHVVPSNISGENEVTLYMRVAEPANNVKLRVGELYQKPLRAVRPSEMLKVRLSRKELDKLDGKTDSIVISCEPKG
jgi:NADPH-dependent 2,4-dienoyl-CoA reductase/sulfur reductase-like enzyme